jgi:phage gp45-like
MVRIGTVTGREVTTNRDGTAERLMLQVRISSRDDIQTVEYVSLPGQDENPVDGSRVYIIEVGASYKIAIGADDGVTPAMDTGEKRLYSQDNAGTIQAFIKLLKSGIIEVNGNADFAVRFSKLEDMVNDLNAKYDVHVHPDPLSGNTGPPTNAPLGLDVSAAKVEEVKLP